MRMDWVCEPKHSQAAEGRFQTLVPVFNNNRIAVPGDISRQEASPAPRITTQALSSRGWDLPGDQSTGLSRAAQQVPLHKELQVEFQAFPRAQAAPDPACHGPGTKSPKKPAQGDVSRAQNHRNTREQRELG